MLSRVIFLLICLCLICGCGSRSAEDFREEGQGITRLLIAELQQIQTRRELVESSPKLKVLFDRLASVALAARDFQKSHPEHDELPLEKRDHELSDELRFELNRIYHLDGGREIIEKSQEEALRTCSKSSNTHI